MPVISARFTMLSRGVRSFFGQPFEIGAVAGFSVEGGLPQQLLGIDEALSERDLLGAADLFAGALLQSTHEFRGLEQRIMRTGVEPGIAAAEPFEVQLAGGE